MGYFGKLEEKSLAQSLRARGYSYSRILQEVKVSKDTLSRWCKDISLTSKQKERLQKSKLLGQKKGSMIAAERKKEQTMFKIQEANKRGKGEVGELTQRDRFILGLSLYVAEGDKGIGKSAFTNSDPRLIKVMMNWFREFMKIPEEKFRGAIWIHEELDKNKAKRFWSDLTGIPPEHFHKTYVAFLKRDSRKIRKHVHSYGIFSIRFSGADSQRRILGWIQAVLGDKIKLVP